jgi:hypothetical protein
MMSNLSRRILVASAAALPALSLPVIGADTSQSELCALGEKLKPILAELQKLEPPRHEAYELAMKATGFDELSRDCTWDERIAANARWDERPPRRMAISAYATKHTRSTQKREISPGGS